MGRVLIKISLEASKGRRDHKCSIMQFRMSSTTVTELLPQQPHMTTFIRT